MLVELRVHERCQTRLGRGEKEGVGGGFIAKYRRNGGIAYDCGERRESNGIIYQTIASGGGGRRDWEDEKHEATLRDNSR